MKLFEIWNSDSHTRQLQKLAASNATGEQTENARQFWRDMAVVDNLDDEVLELHYRAAIRRKRNRQLAQGVRRWEQTRLRDAIASGKASKRVQKLAAKYVDSAID